VIGPEFFKPLSDEGYGIGSESGSACASGCARTTASSDDLFTCKSAPNEDRQILLGLLKRNQARVPLLPLIAIPSSASSAIRTARRGAAPLSVRERQGTKHAHRGFWC
jgi:hypothetical protein